MKITQYHRKRNCKKRRKDVTIVGAGYANYLAMQVAEKLAGEGVSVEVVDPRTLTLLTKM